MNKKILVITVSLLAVVMLATPLVSAKPWEEKSNEKFQSFSVILMGGPVNLTPDYEVTFKPNEENPNVAVQTWGNNIVYNEIVIGGVKHYLMGVDFEYSQSCKYTAVGSPAMIPGYGLYTGSISNHFVINYKYDFSAVSGGIDGTLEMLFLSNNGIVSIRSLRGTGELQNVQVMATASLPLGHEGIVIGWPE